MVRLRCVWWALCLSCVLGVPGQGLSATKRKQDPRLVRGMKQLQSTQWKKRVLAARSLSRLGAAAAPAATLLLGLLADKHPEVRGAAAFALGAIGPKAAKAIPGLVKATRDKHPWVRGFSAFALARMGPAAHKALYAGLSTKNAQARILSAIALSRVSTLPKAWQIRVRTTLYEAPRHKTSWVRYYAVMSLRKMRSTHPGTLRLFQKTVQDKHKKVRDVTLRALRRFGPAAKALIPTLLKMRKAKLVMERRLVIQALSHIGTNNPAVIAALKQDYVSPKYTVRWEAWRGLARLGVKLPKASLNGPIPIRKAPTSRPSSRSASRPTSPASRPTSRPAARNKAATPPQKRPTSRPTLRPTAPAKRPATRPTLRR